MTDSSMSLFSYDESQAQGAGIGTPRRASNEIVESLRRMIITMEILPGTSVSITDLMKSLDCGRTPLREAIQRLEHERLLVSEMRRGIIISDLSIIDFQQLSELRRAIEPFMSSLAASRVTESELAKLEEMVKQAEEASRQTNGSRVCDLDIEFHNLLAHATRNQYLMGTVRSLSFAISRFSRVAWQQTSQGGRSVVEHSRLLDALKAHDSEEAQHQMYAHLTASCDRILQHFLGGNVMSGVPPR